MEALFGGTSWKGVKIKRGRLGGREGRLGGRERGSVEEREAEWKRVKLSGRE